MHFLKRIVKSVADFPNKVSIFFDKTSVTYNQLYRFACHLSKQFLIYSNYENKVCLIVSEKSIFLYQSLLACFFSNLIYTPINIVSCLEKNKKIVKIANPDFICIGVCQFETACQILCAIDNKIVFVLDVRLYELLLQSAFPHHFVLISDQVCEDEIIENIQLPEKNNFCYLFFTSGSTGTPKGVPITFENFSSYLDSIFLLFRFNENDRIMQVSDIAFDLSMHEIFSAWCAGAVLYAYNEQALGGVANYIHTHKISHAFFVPSSIPIVIYQCNYFNLNLISLKKIFFCGEVFPLSYARMFEPFVPRAAIVNLYGPTETTIACSYHFYRKQENYANLHSVPIGFAFPNVSLTLSDEGELIVVGKQVFQGYWPRQPENKQLDCYRSGDFVFFDTRWGYVFQTRKDDQWKIQGYRIEKNEVERVLRSVIRLDEIYIVPHFDKSNLISGLLAFSTQFINIKKYKKQLSLFIPLCAIPDRCIQLKHIPKMPNGKIDYKSLDHMKEERSDLVSIMNE